MNWAMDGRRFAKKVKLAASGEVPEENAFEDDEVAEKCGTCGQAKMDTATQVWQGLPAGVKFDPNDKEILDHLAAKIGRNGTKPHVLLDEFIPTLGGDDGICYTHPEKLPGVKQDGKSSHFFHRPANAYTKGNRKRRKVHTDDEEAGGETRWHKTGKTRAVQENGKLIGWKKIMVLYTNFRRKSKPKKTNWVMHQYHLGHSEDEREGEMVVSKVFFQTQPRSSSARKATESDEEEPEVVAAETIEPESTTTAVAAASALLNHRSHVERQHQLPQQQPEPSVSDEPPPPPPPAPAPAPQAHHLPVQLHAPAPEVVRPFPSRDARTIQIAERLMQAEVGQSLRGASESALMRLAPCLTNGISTDAQELRQFQITADDLYCHEDMAEELVCDLNLDCSQNVLSVAAGLGLTLEGEASDGLFDLTFLETFETMPDISSQELREWFRKPASQEGPGLKMSGGGLSSGITSEEIRQWFDKPGSQEAGDSLSEIADIFMSLNAGSARSRVKPTSNLAVIAARTLSSIKQKHIALTQ